MERNFIEIYEGQDLLKFRKIRVKFKRYCCNLSESDTELDTDFKAVIIKL